MSDYKRPIVSKSVKVCFEDISSEGDEPLLVHEYFMDTVRRKLVDELKLSYEKIAYLISVFRDEPWRAEEVRDVLEVRASPDRELESNLFRLAGLELVAVKSMNEHITEGGHHYFAERCVFCGVNYIDNGLYDDGAPCAQRP